MSIQLQEYQIQEYFIPSLNKKIVTFGCGGTYKTFVFDIGATEWSSRLELQEYSNKKDAVMGHYKWCEKYLEKDRLNKVLRYMGDHVIMPSIAIN